MPSGMGRWGHEWEEGEEEAARREKGARKGKLGPLRVTCGT